MKRELSKHSPHKHPRDARRGYRLARQLKRCAAALVQSVPNSIIERGSR